MELLIPTCNCIFIGEEEEDKDQMKPEKHLQNYYYYYNHPNISTGTITGTIFGYRRGKVGFCIHPNPNDFSNPILVLELAVRTTILAKEMQEGTLRIVLESSTASGFGSNYPCSLLSTPLWNMYFNGRKVGYAVKRRPSNSDLEALRLMRSVVVGAGVTKEMHMHDQFMYLRAKFQRVGGSSSNSESFHLMDPDGCIGQELSIFFFRSS